MDKQRAHARTHFRLGLAFLLIAAVFRSGGTTWTQTNLVNWTPGITVGVPGGIPTYRTNLIDVTKAPYNADKTAASDASSSIQAAINAAKSNDVVYFPAGTYRVSSQLNVPPSKSGVTVRGAGTNTVLLAYNTSGATIYVGSATDWNWVNPSSGNVVSPGGLFKGSTNVSIANTSPFMVGSIAKIGIDDNLNQTDNPVTLHVSGYGRNRNQKVLITAKTATTLTFWPPLYSSYNGKGGAVNSCSAQANFVGIEDLSIEMTNTTASVMGVYFEQIYGCWMKGVKIRHCYSYNVYVWDGLFCEVRKCDVGQAVHTGNNGSGLKFDRISACLVEDNIVSENFPTIEMNFGSSGNVVAYNFCFDSFDSGQSGASIDSNHGPHNSFNLYEGNVAPNLQCDGYFGSTSDDTVTRNWFHGTQPELTSVQWCMTLNRFTRNYNVIGNLFGTNKSMSATGLVFGNPNIGNWGNNGKFAPPWADWQSMITAVQNNPGSGPGAGGFQELDTNVLASTTLLGNYYFYTHSIPPSEDLGTNSLSNSMYLSGKPVWFGNLSWPPFDTANPTPRFDSIPAGYRYVHGTDPPGGPPDSQPPTTPTGLAATGGTNQIGLTWNASSDNVGVTGYQIERSQGSGSTNYNIAGTTSGTSFNDTGLFAGTVYNYRVRATDAAGNLSGYSGIATATTSPDQTPPTVPAGLMATAIGSNQIQLSWIASTDNVVVMGYRVERSQGTGATNFFQVGTPTATSFSDTGLVSGVVYNYRVRATDAAGNLSGYSTVASATAGSHVALPGLVAAYSFDQGAGTTLLDLSGSGNSGVINGAIWTTGRYGGALSFDGISNVIVISNSASLNISTGMTLEAWVYPTVAVTNWHTIMHREPDCYYLHASSPDGSMFPAGGGVFNGTEQHLAESASVPVDSWTHLATTYDGVSLKVYVNGGLAASTSVSGSIQTSSNPLRIGGNTYADQFFSGLIDEVRIYNRALTAAEIMNDTLTPIGGVSRPLPPTNLRIVSQ